MFTTAEKNYIRQSFEMDRVIQHFFKEGIQILDPKDTVHILKVLAFRDQKIGFIGKEGHDLMHSIYHKLGFGKDGKTSLSVIKREKERLQQLADAELKELRKSAINIAMAKIKELENIVAELETSNSDISDFEARERKKLEDLLALRLKRKEKQAILNEKRKIEKTINDLNVPELRQLAKKQGLSGYSNLRRDELLNLLDKEMT